MDRSGPLAPEVLGPKRPQLGLADVTFTIPRLIHPCRRGTERHELLTRPEPVSWKANDVALRPRVFVACLRFFRFHGFPALFWPALADAVRPGASIRLNWLQFVSIGKVSMALGDRDESFLTVAEVAATLKLNQQTVRNWIDQGSLPALRVGRRVRIRRSDFERLLEDGYMAGSGSARQDTGPSAEDFWSGEPVGLAEPSRPSDSSSEE